MAAAKRSRSAVAASTIARSVEDPVPPAKKRAVRRNASTAAITNPDINGEVLDAPNATRASPDSDVNEDIVPGRVKRENGPASESPLSDVPPASESSVQQAPHRPRTSTRAEADVTENTAKATKGKASAKAASAATKPIRAKPSKDANTEPDRGYDPEADGDGEEVNEEDIKEAVSRPPPVNSDYLPLPWKGRLGYACLNTYLRNSNPPVFSSRTCRIQSILEHRHPLMNPDEPEHPTKNRPDRNKPADVELGQRYVEELCLANVRDIAKMIRWNERYHIRFLRLSSEMFPFASHSEYGYKLAPFATDALAEAGKIIAQFNHRVSTRKSHHVSRR
jgi:UV DNA damage endonuclease